MKPISLIGIILIIVGILIFVYHGFAYTKHENVAQIGDLKVTATTQENVYLPPILGGLIVAAGVFLVIIGRKR